MGPAEGGRRKALDRLQAGAREESARGWGASRCLCHVGVEDFPDADYEDVRVKLAEVEESWIANTLASITGC